MFVYKFLEISNWEEMRVEIINYLNNAKTQDVRNKTMTYLDRDEVFNNCPIFKNYWVSLKKENSKFVIIKLTLPPGYNHHPHIDNLYLHQTAPQCPDFTKYCLAFNFPLENCDDTYTKFYKYTEKDIKIDDTITVEGKPHYGTYRRLEIDQLEEFDRYYLTKPVVINSSVPHNINNTDHSTRITLNVRLNPDPWDIL